MTKSNHHSDDILLAAPTIMSDGSLISFMLVSWLIGSPINSGLTMLHKFILAKALSDLMIVMGLVEIH